ncbi:MAG: nitrous oxide reductase family maturation protein NosD [Candidatus Hodarchaeota archaeon]
MKQITFMTLLLITLIIPLGSDLELKDNSFDNLPSTSVEPLQKFSQRKILSNNVQYGSTSPIRIDNNSDFHAQAAAGNWSGDGSSANPYMIQRLTIIGPSDRVLIEIRYTDVHFHIRNCFLSKGYTGIQFYNVSYGYLSSNTVVNTSGPGIALLNSDYNLLFNNTITHNRGTGISLYNSDYNDLSNNTVSKTNESGITLLDSDHNLIFNNSVFNNLATGIQLKSASYCNLSYNTVSNNSERGISVSGVFQRWDSVNFIYGLKLVDNLVTYNFGGGILLNITQYPTLEYNIIANNTSNGIDLIHTSFGNIEGNTIANNTGYGIYIPEAIGYGEDYGYNSIQINNFIGNNIEIGSQAFDSVLSGISNFASNHWDDWSSPDYDGDGIVDHVYPIAGKAYNHDFSPRVLLNHLLFGEITYPNRYETCSGDVTVRWTSAIDLLGRNLTYSVLYSTSNGKVWYPVKTGIKKLFYDWDTTTTISWAESVLVRIEVSSVDGTWVMDETIYTNRIMIDNRRDSYTFLISPIIGEVLHGSVVIEWAAAIDIFGHSVTYLLSYSPDNGDSWVILGSDLQTTSYSWDTTYVKDGSQYLIRVDTSWRMGVKYSVTSDTFTINNHHHLQPFTILSPQGAERLSDLITIQWSLAEDLFHHEVTYSLSYSADLGLHWVTLVSNLTKTSFLWDTTLVDDGAQYLIQVNASCTEGSWYATSSVAFTIVSTLLTSNFSLTRSSTTNSPSGASITLISIFEFLELGSILFFVMVMVLVVRRHRVF